MTLLILHQRKIRTSSPKLCIMSGTNDEERKAMPSTSSEPELHQGPFDGLAHLAGGLEVGPTPTDDYEELDIGRLAFVDTAGARQRYQRLKQRMNTPRHIVARDKTAFVMGTLGLTLSAFWLGKSPATFYQLYTGAAVALFATRWLIYKSKNFHYYLLDYCYTVHALLLLHLWVLPHSAFLHKITFAYASGPLAWSIVAFRNSLVLHSLDKITSLFLHLFPAGVAWTERWHPDVHIREANRKSPEAMREWDAASLTQLVLLPCVPYLLWAVLYYIKVFIISSKKIQEKNYETLFKWITTRNAGNIIGRIVLSVPPPWQPLAYMCVHISLTTMTFMLCKLWWEYHGAHTAFLLFVFAMSAWNGASFYFQYFAKHYFAGLGERSKSGSG